ncbi:restriction endonuclease subunit S [Microbacterium sp. cf332]|uniref:restriction endonuclease subunit S n=1 Tax=Microbacterium sp. cf332 TaxID=1761804 RepID=UPI00088A5E24|nr:restriction endonuclease subunit S [Microbacterium sp. cf332]SDQ11884.1 type I restriction enzyme, S subunit [Microbacterium sp. cf332]
MRADLAARLGPIKWDLVPLWSVAPRVVNKNIGLVENNLLSLSYGRVIRKEIDAVGGLRPESYETYNIVEDGDVVLRMTDLQNDKKSIRVAQASERGLITSAYITVRPDASKTDPRFIAAVLRAYDIQKAYYEMGAGVRQNLGYAELIDLPIPLPPRETQRYIADYLDRETDEIDAMIARMDELARVLEDRRRRSIDNSFAAVAKTAPLWALTAGVIDCPHTTPQLDEAGPAEAVRTASVRSGKYVAGKGIAVSLETARQRNGAFPPRPGDLFFTREAPAGEVALVPKGIFCLGQRMVLIRVDPEVTDSRFLLYAMCTKSVRDEFRLSAGGSTVPNLKLGTIRATRIPFAALADQQRIADQLDEVTSRIDAMLAKVAELKSLLTERRAALITDLVTGRKEVA